MYSSDKWTIIKEQLLVWERKILVKPNERNNPEHYRGQVTSENIQIKKTVKVVWEEILKS